MSARGPAEDQLNLHKKNLKVCEMLFSFKKTKQTFLLSAVDLFISRCLSLHFIRYRIEGKYFREVLVPN